MYHTPGTTPWLHLTVLLSVLKWKWELVDSETNLYMEPNRLLCVVWGPQEPHTELIQRLARGWDIHPPDTTEPAEVLEAEFRIMTSAGVTDVGECVKAVPPYWPFKDRNGNRPTHVDVAPNFSAETVEEQIAAWREYFPDGEWPGPADAVAAITARVWAEAPVDWAKLVIDRYYAPGLRFIFLSYDSLAGGNYGCYGLDVWRHVFFSAPEGNAEHKVHGSRHFCAFTEASEELFACWDDLLAWVEKRVGHELPETNWSREHKKLEAARQAAQEEGRNRICTQTDITICPHCRKPMRDHWPSAKSA